jgi:hypothetical protein
MFKSILLAAIAVVSLMGTAHAARPDTRHMTCAQARDFVLKYSPVVMTYGYSDRAGYLYSKFSARSCRSSSDDTDVTAWVPTLDSPSCYIGYVCNNYYLAKTIEGDAAGRVPFFVVIKSHLMHRNKLLHFFGRPL